MNPHKQLLRWLVKAQIFTLIVLILMPTLIHYLGDTVGKVAYTGIVVLAVGLAWTLHRLLAALE